MSLHCIVALGRIVVVGIQQSRRRHLLSRATLFFERASVIPNFMRYSLMFEAMTSHRAMCLLQPQDIRRSENEEV